MSNLSFPPLLEKGSKVWTTDGYRNHGPLDGPKQNILGPQRGIVEGRYQEFSFSNYLYVIRWDNGQQSRHYATGLFSIGRFDTLAAFEAAIKPASPAVVTRGPQGGFRGMATQLEYDGVPIQVELGDRDGDFWETFLRPIYEKFGVKVTEVRLPPKPPRPRSSARRADVHLSRKMRLAKKSAGRAVSKPLVERIFKAVDEFRHTQPELTDQEVLDALKVSTDAWATVVSKNEITGNRAAGRLGDATI